MIRVDIDLRPRLLGIRDQGQRQTCAAYAASAAHEVLRASGAALSPEYLYYFARLGRGRGCSFATVAAALAKQGQPVDTECPAFSAEPAANWRPAQPTEVFRRDSEHGKPTVAAVYDSVQRGDTPILGLDLPDSFFRPTAPWVIEDAGIVRGRHAVLAVGSGEYANAPVLLVRNSWGSSWGDAGYAWLSQSFLSQRLVGILRLTEDLT